MKAVASDGVGLRALVVLVAAVAMAALTLRLGFWQLDRAAQKQALQAGLDARSAMPFLQPTELASTLPGANAQHDRRIRLRGQWLPSETVFLDNRQMNARPGFFVLTPLRLPDAPAVATGGAAGARLVWVQRGWVARDNNDRSKLPTVPTPPGEVEVVGRVAPAPARLFQFAADTSGAIRQNLDLQASSIALGQSVLPLTVVQTEAPANGTDGLMRDWPHPAVDVAKHLGYAFQWFALSALVTGLYVWFQLIRPRRRRDETA